MKKLFYPAVLMVMVFGACFNSSQTKGVEAKEATGIEGLVFGEAFVAEGFIGYDELLKKLETADSMAVQVAGKVDGVCQAKGCWMNIVSEEDSSKEKMFVKFKDYGFFMPLDCSGKKVIMNGQAYREITSVDELRHYAEDADESQEVIDAITEPKVELKFMASGVILLEG